MESIRLHSVLLRNHQSGHVLAQHHSSNFRFRVLQWPGGFPDLSVLATFDLRHWHHFDHQFVSHAEALAINMVDTHINLFPTGRNVFNYSIWVHPAYLFKIKTFLAKNWIFPWRSRKVWRIISPHRLVLSTISHHFFSLQLVIPSMVSVAKLLLWSSSIARLLKIEYSSDQLYNFPKTLRRFELLTEWFLPVWINPLNGSNFLSFGKEDIESEAVRVAWREDSLASLVKLVEVGQVSEV